MGKTKTVQKNDPWAPAQPYILNNLSEQQKVQSAQQPLLDQYSKMQMDTYGRVAPGAEAGIRGSQDLVNSTLHGDYLQGNPYIDGIIGKTRQNITDGVNSQFSSAGRYGSGNHAGILSRELADAENALRYQNYATERGYQNDAITQSQSLMNGTQGLLNNAAELPWISVQASNGAVRNASNGYGTQTTTQKQGLGGIAGGLLGSALSGWASGGFKGV